MQPQDAKFDKDAPTSTPTQNDNITTELKLNEADCSTLMQALHKGQKAKVVENLKRLTRRLTRITSHLKDQEVRAVSLAKSIEEIENSVASKGLHVDGFQEFEKAVCKFRTQILGDGTKISSTFSATCITSDSTKEATEESLSRLRANNEPPVSLIGSVTVEIEQGPKDDEKRKVSSTLTSVPITAASDEAASKCSYGPGDTRSRTKNEISYISQPDLISYFKQITGSSKELGQSDAESKIGKKLIRPLSTAVSVPITIQPHELAEKLPRESGDTDERTEKEIPHLRSHSTLASIPVTVLPHEMAVKTIYRPSLADEKTEKELIRPISSSASKKVSSKEERAVKTVIGLSGGKTKTKSRPLLTAVSTPITILPHELAVKEPRRPGNTDERTEKELPRKAALPLEDKIIPEFNQKIFGVSASQANMVQKPEYSPSYVGSMTETDLPSEILRNGNKKVKIISKKESKRENKVILLVPEKEHSSSDKDEAKKVDKTTISLPTLEKETSQISKRIREVNAISKVASRKTGQKSIDDDEAIRAEYDTSGDTTSRTERELDLDVSEGLGVESTPKIVIALKRPEQTLEQWVKIDSLVQQMKKDKVLGRKSIKARSKSEKSNDRASRAEYEKEDVASRTEHELDDLTDTETKTEMEALQQAFMQEDKNMKMIEKQLSSPYFGREELEITTPPKSKRQLEAAVDKKPKHKDKSPSSRADRRLKFGWRQSNEKFDSVSGGTTFSADDEQPKKMPQAVDFAPRKFRQSSPRPPSNLSKSNASNRTHNSERSYWPTKTIWAEQSCISLLLLLAAFLCLVYFAYKALDALAGTYKVSIDDCAQARYLCERFQTCCFTTCGSSKWHILRSKVFGLTQERGVDDVIQPE